MAKERRLHFWLTAIQIIERVGRNLDQSFDSLYSPPQGTGPSLYEAIEHVVSTCFELTQSFSVEQDCHVIVGFTIQPMLPCPDVADLAVMGVLI